MTKAEFEQRLHEVWLNAYNNGLSIAHNIYTATSNEVTKVEDHATQAIKHAEAVLAAYKTAFETYVEKLEGKTK